MGGVMNDKRGEIFERSRIEQVVRFHGLRYGKITPTDIDLFVDFGNRLFVWVELKHRGVQMPYGQKLALERVCNATAKSGIESWVLLAVHDIPVPHDIDAATCKVVQAFTDGRWRVVSGEPTVRDAITSLCKKLGYAPGE